MGKKQGQGSSVQSSLASSGDQHPGQAVQTFSLYMQPESSFWSEVTGAFVTNHSQQDWGDLHRPEPYAVVMLALHAAKSMKIPDLSCCVNMLSAADAAQVGVSL
jgi:hypothetical protein